MHKTTMSSALLLALGLGGPLAGADNYFDLEASFLVCENTSCDEETSSEIIAASADGMTLAYSDSPGGTVGLIDITDPANPGALGAIPMGSGGEPTSVALFTGFGGVEYVVVGVNTSPGFDENFDGDHAGELRVYELGACVADPLACSPAAVFDLGGQPDSVAVSPDGAYIAVAVENERDEEACHTVDGVLVPAYYDEEDDCIDAGHQFGRLPQPNPGWLAVISGADQDDPANNWTLEAPVALTGLSGLLYPTDPEPEYVSINSNNEVVLTLQENNAVVIVDLASLSVLDSYSAGSVDLRDVDTNENGLIELADDQEMRLREPDGTTWIGDTMYATANEGDMDGGSRGYTIFEVDGSVVYESYESYDYLQARTGHYPDERSENKGSEPEAVRYAADFDGNELLFVASERSSTVAVYDVADKANPVLKQFLPAVMGPESVITVTGRADGAKLAVIANEVDDEARSMVNIFLWKEMAAPDYPTVVSADDTLAPSGNGFPRPIPFGALSGLTAGDSPAVLYAVHDSFYKEPRIFHLDQSAAPAVIGSYTPLWGIPQDALDDYDLEGIARREDGGFWLVSEGSGTIGDPDRPFEDENLLIRVSANGEVLQQVSLPAEVAAKQVRFGFEGVAVTGSGDEERVYVAFQREWTGDPKGVVRIGEYRPHTGKWKFHWYPLDPREADAGWVGLSELVAVGEREFLVLERDNQAGPYARIKRIYRVDLDEGRDAFQPGDKGEGKGKAIPVLRKTLLTDLLPVYRAQNGWVPDKPEGMTVDAAGNLVVVTDNDGVDDATGQSWFFNLGAF